MNGKSVYFMTDNPHITSARISVRKRIVVSQKEKSRDESVSFRLGVPKQAPTTYEIIRDLRDTCIGSGSLIPLKDYAILFWNESL